jgi:hypothetical protein
MADVCSLVRIRGSRAPGDLSSTHVNHRKTPEVIHDRIADLVVLYISRNMKIGTESD